MKSWKRSAGCLGMSVFLATAVMAGPAPEKGGTTNAAPGGVTSAERMTELAKATAALTAKAVAQYLKLPKEKTKKLTDAYVEFAESSQKRLLAAIHSGDREKMLAGLQENRKNMEKMLEETLGEEQAKKAGPLMGSTFGAVTPSIRVLLIDEVEKAKIEKALPTLVDHALNQQKLIEHMRGGAVSPQDIMPKMRELNDKTTKELAKIVGEKAAQNWRNRTQVGDRNMGGGGEGEGQSKPRLPPGHP